MFRKGEKNEGRERGKDLVEQGNSSVLIEYKYRAISCSDAIVILTEEISTSCGGWKNKYLR